MTAPTWPPAGPDLRRRRSPGRCWWCGRGGRANIATMAAYCAGTASDFAPHAKTTMAPALIAAQLDAGAWGITVATPNQALVLRELGVPRVLIANEVLDPARAALAGRRDRAGLGGLLPGRLAGRGAAAAAALGEPGVLRVLVELGHPGGRTGCRTVADCRGGPGGRRGRPARARRGHRLRGRAARRGGGGRVPRPVAPAVRPLAAAAAAGRGARVGRRQRVVRPGGRRGWPAAGGPA